MVIAVGTDRLWAAFCEVLGLGAEVRDDARFASNPVRVAHRAELIPILQARLSTRPAAHWLPLLRGAEIPCGPIHTVPDLLNHPQYLARQNLVASGDLTTLANPLKLSATPPAYRRPPPRLGEHNEEILRELS
jgi:crotonobetainyl-CoA:carnitine CoA-transferase CaiB-like acyl-CoA transferase